jgi:hypothetical protein
MVRQSRAHDRKNASGNVSCICSMSSSASALRSVSSKRSDGGGVIFRVELDGFHVAADGIDVFASSAGIIRPSANAASASAAAAAIARALSNLNCFRSALRLAVTSSEVNSRRRLREVHATTWRRGWDLRLPVAVLRWDCLASQLGSLRERLPFPKKPRLQRVMLSLRLVTQTERVVGSNVPSHRGFSTRVGNTPKMPKAVIANLLSIGEKEIGRGFA